LHLLQLRGVGGSIGEAERRQPQPPVRDEAEHVDSRPARLERLEVLARRAPADRQIIRVAVDRAARLLRSRIGKQPKPQLPTTSVVTLRWIALTARGSISSV
jgi:hypothetical protein